MNPYEIYEDSNGKATQELYQNLTDKGVAGVVAVNLFRAQKCSARAKEYRRGSHKREAYDRKNWSMQNLANVLDAHANELQIKWGWKLDPEQPKHCWVLYVDLPTGQVSFHAEQRGKGPDYVGDWDKSLASVSRVLKYVASVLAGEAPVITPIKPQRLICHQCGNDNPPDETKLDNCGEPWKVILNCDVCGAASEGPDRATAEKRYAAGDCKLEVNLSSEEYRSA